MLDNIVETDVLIIGGGLAGMLAAIKARSQGVDVTLVDKGYVGRTGSSAFAGGSWLLFNPDWGHDLLDSWVSKISAVTEYLNNREWTEIVLMDSYQRYKDLVSWGIEFIKSPIKLGQTWNPPGVDSVTLQRSKFTPLIRNKVLDSGVKLLDRVMIADLIKLDGRIVGAIGFHTRSGNFYMFKSRATVMSSGAGSLKQAGLPIHYWTADGDAMAYRAGAELSGKEFEMKGFTMAEFPAWRGHGMAAMACIRKYVNAEGNEVNRDVVAYEVHTGRGPIFWNLDAATQEEKESALHHFVATNTVLEAERAGVDVNRGGKHPLVGSVWDGASAMGGTGGIWPASTDCATNLPGLYAAGESLCIRQAGSRYPLVGMGLTGATVTGARAGLASAKYASKTVKCQIDDAEIARMKELVYAPIERKGGFSPRWVTQQLQNAMLPYYIWQIKNGERMQAALTIVEFIKSHLVPKIRAMDSHELRLAHETRNMVLNAEMMLRASIFRTESRGTHYREDYPRRDDPEWLAWVKLRDKDGRMETYKESIPEKWWPNLSKPYEERYPIRFPGE